MEWEKFSGGVSPLSIWQGPYRIKLNQLRVKITSRFGYWKFVENKKSHRRRI